jgi:DNA polymerase-1
VEPDQVADFIALRGDVSDRIPGLAGVGLVSAAALLKRYGSIEQLLAAGRFAAHADQLRLFKKIATMDKTAPLPPIRNQKPKWSDAAQLASDWDLKKLAERLEALVAPVR